MDPEESWYTDAIIYGIDVERFADGNGDGIGDFIGLTERLPYLQNLGITCIWLLPFFESPDRDNGYDVSDYYTVHPKVGHRGDFLNFLHKAGECGIRVVIDLVINHTSNEHPWFEAARRDEKSLFRDYYVWSAFPPPVDPDSQPVFPGEETSLWTYDEVASAYYYHKFYHFQPDLNVTDPAVRDAVLRIVDYWLALGVSGFRLDAAPFVISENGLPRADPPDPHGVLRELSGFIRKRRPGGFLLGEVNLPPGQIEDYFGRGDQLGLLLNFMLASYMFAALAKQQAAPIGEALSLLPEPPAGCGWANFLRNLDELDLSTMPEDLREAVFEKFAPEESMRVFGRGIRRRLAPMLEGDPRRIELAFSLVLSLRGAPLFVYGDEIGLGEDLSLKGRNAVRAPMQWTDGPNAGFSTAPAERLVQKPVSKGKFSYERINVAAQDKDPDSLLNHLRRLIFLRRREPIFRKGRYIRMSASDPAVFVHGYEDAGEIIVFLHNLSGRKVSADVKLDSAQPGPLTDLLTGAEHSITRRLLIEIGPFGYKWLRSRHDGG